MKKPIGNTAKGLVALLSAALLFCGLFLSGLPVRAAVSRASSSKTLQEPPFRYGRTQLDGAALYAYDLLVEQEACDTPAETLVPEPGVVDRESMKLAMRTFLADYPECFWLTGGYEGSLSGDYYFEVYLKTRWTGGTLMMMRQAMEQQAEHLLEGIGDGDVWETALQIHDRLVDYIRYEASDKDQTLYGALVERRCVCTGYARAFQYLLNRAGIAAFTVEGDAVNSTVSEPERHAWTVFWLDEETCVYTDLTWDDHGDEPWHYYFAVSAEQIGADHFPETPIPLPACSHRGFDYYRQGRGLFLQADSDPAEAAAFCVQSGTDQYRLDLLLDEGLTLDGWLDAHARELIAALGYTNADSCGYAYRTLFKISEYRLTLEIKGGVKQSEPPAGPSVTEPEPTESLTAAPPETTAEMTETTTETVLTGPETEATVTDSPAVQEETAESVPAEKKDARESSADEPGAGPLDGLWNGLQKLAKGAAVVIGALTAMILGLAVLARRGRKG